MECKIDLTSVSVSAERLSTLLESESKKIEQALLTQGLLGQPIKQGVDWGKCGGDQTKWVGGSSGPVIITFADGTQHEFKEAAIKIKFKDDELVPPKDFNNCIVVGVELAHLNPTLLQQLLVAGQAISERFVETAENVGIFCDTVVRPSMMEMIDQLQCLAKDWLSICWVPEEPRVWSRVWYVCREWMLGGDRYYGKFSFGSKNISRNVIPNNGSGSNYTYESMEEVILILIVIHM